MTKNHFFNLFFIFCLTLGIVSCSKGDENRIFNVKKFNNWTVYQVKANSKTLTGVKTVDAQNHVSLLFLYKMGHCKKPNSVSVNIKKDFSTKINPGTLSVGFGNEKINIKSKKYNNSKFAKDFMSNASFFMGSLHQFKNDKNSGLVLIYNVDKFNNLLNKNRKYKYINMGIVTGIKGEKGRLTAIKYVNFNSKKLDKAQEYASKICGN